MANSTIGTAYIQIQPTTQGLQGSLEDALNGGGAAGRAGENAGSMFSAGFGKVLGVAGSLAMEGAKMAAAAAADLVKESIASYAEYEQLAGGAQLMFGDAYDYVAEKAKNAFATVQMSQSEYLAQANGFATGLKTALGGDALGAAELADRIITAEADIVAATGASAESIQNAFNGIMKTNYTMLDNLQLGITPTKAGFQELIDKVNEWNEENGRTTNYVIDNLADCQKALVDYVEMVGVSGYAAKEASDTLQGSIASMKAAWSNLVTGMASEDVSMEELAQNFAQSAIKAFQNILPVFTRAISGLVAMLRESFNAFTESVPEVLPDVIDSVKNIVEGLSEEVPDLLENLITTLGDSLPELLPALVEGIFAIDKIILAIIPKIPELCGKIIASLVKGLIEAAPALYVAIAEGINSLFWDILSSVANYINNFGEAGIEIAEAVFEGITTIFSDPGSILYPITESLLIPFKDAVVKFYNVGKDFVVNLLEGIKAAWSNLTGWIEDKVSWIVDKVVSMFKSIPVIGDLFNELSGDTVSGTVSVTNTLKDNALVETSAYAAQLTASAGNTYSRDYTSGGGAGQSFGNGFTQNVTINSPSALSPSEVARQTRNATKQMVNSLNGGY